jgi:hypothetical protein
MLDGRRALGVPEKQLGRAADYADWRRFAGTECGSEGGVYRGDSRRIRALGGASELAFLWYTLISPRLALSISNINNLKSFAGDFKAGGGVADFQPLFKQHFRARTRPGSQN